VVAEIGRFACDTILKTNKRNIYLTILKNNTLIVFTLPFSLNF